MGQETNSICAAKRGHIQEVCEPFLSSIKQSDIDEKLLLKSFGRQKAGALRSAIWNGYYALKIARFEDEKTVVSMGGLLLIGGIL